MQIAQTETLPTDENRFFQWALWATKKVFFATDKNFFYKSPVDFT